MFPHSKKDNTQAQCTVIVGILILPEFPMSCLTSMIEPLRAANEIADCTAFTWKIITETGERVRSSAQVGFDPDLALGAAQDVDYLFLLGSPTSGFVDSKASEGHLRRLVRHGVAIGGVSGGVFPLARTGLLASRECSVHWCYGAAFAQEFPDIAMRDDVIVVDRGSYTVSGAAAAFDLMLLFVEQRLGGDVATEVACWFQHPLVRGQGVRQKVPTFRRESTADALPVAVTKAVDILARRIADPISIEALAEEVGVSVRQLERQFNKATGQSPLRYYRTLRMKAARQLVLYSKNSMIRIATAIGYETVAPLLQHYRQEFGISPTEERNTINRFRVEGNRPLPDA